MVDRRERGVAPSTDVPLAPCPESNRMPTARHEPEARIRRVCYMALRLSGVTPRVFLYPGSHAAPARRIGTYSLALGRGRSRQVCVSLVPGLGALALFLLGHLGRHPRTTSRVASL